MDMEAKCTRRRKRIDQVRVSNVLVDADVKPVFYPQLPHSHCCNGLDVLDICMSAFHTIVTLTQLHTDFDHEARAHWFATSLDILTYFLTVLPASTVFSSISGS